MTRLLTPDGTVFLLDEEDTEATTPDRTNKSAKSGITSVSNNSLAQNLTKNKRINKNNIKDSFVKTINGKTTVVCYVSNKHFDLTVQTVYSGKSKKSLATTPSGGNSFSQTSETLSGTAFNNIISQSATSNNPQPENNFENSILYIDPNKKRTNNWLSLNRLQLPLGENQYGSIRRITYTDGKVKIQNPIHMTQMQEKMFKAGSIDEFGNSRLSKDEAIYDGAEMEEMYGE